MGYGVIGIENSMYKGPVATKNLPCWRMCKGAHVG